MHVFRKKIILPYSQLNKTSISLIFGLFIELGEKKICRKIQCKKEPSSMKNCVSVCFLFNFQTSGEVSMFYIRKQMLIYSIY